MSHRGVDMIPLTITVGASGTASASFKTKLGIIFLVCVKPSSTNSSYALEFFSPGGFGLDGRPDDGSAVITGNRTFESLIPIIGENTLTISNATADTYTVELYLKAGI